MKRRIPYLQHLSTVTHGLETGRLCRLLAGKQARADVTNVYLSDLVLIDISDGSVERIARRVKVMDYWLSPDGTKIAFTTMRMEFYDIVIVSLSDCASLETKIEQFIMSQIRPREPAHHLRENTHDLDLFFQQGKEFVHAQIIYY